MQLVFALGIAFIWTETIFSFPINSDLNQTYEDDSISSSSNEINFLRSDDNVEKYSEEDLNYAIKRFYSDDAFASAFSDEDILTLKDKRGNIIIDVSNQFKWIKKLTKGKFDFLKQDAQAERLSKRFSDFNASTVNFDAEQGPELTTYIQSIFHKPKCSEINENTFVGICEINPFKHKLVNYDLHERPHLLRGLLMPSVGLAMLTAVELVNFSLCNGPRLPKLQAIFYNPICVGVGMVRSTVRHMATALLINGFQDITGSPFANEITGIQLALSYVFMEYKGFDCVDAENKHTPIEKFTNDIDLKYITGSTKDPSSDGDSLHVFEFAVFPGNVEGDIGYGEINRNAKWRFDTIRRNTYRFSYKHVGNLDRDLLNYYLSTFSIHQIFSAGFKSLRNENYAIIKEITNNYKLIKTLDKEDNDDHPVLAPISKLYINHRARLFVFNNIIHTVDHDEPMSLSIENPC